METSVYDKISFSTYVNNTWKHVNKIKRRICMPYSNMYNLCCKYHGKMVRITGRDGSVHVGEITRVNKDYVWLRPRNLGGYGYGFYGGYGRGSGIPFALGFITGIVLATAFFW